MKLIYFLTLFSAIAFPSVGNPLAAASDSKETTKNRFRPASSPGLQLESLVVDVNGERRHIDPKDGISVVAGDLVTIVNAWLVDKSRSNPIVDVVGYEPKIKRTNIDDLGRVIDTGSDLNIKHSVGADGHEYQILVTGPSIQYGETRLFVEPPILRSFEIEVNGNRKKYLEGQKLILGMIDKIQVVAVETNVRGNENVKHELFTKKERNGETYHELRFSRGNKVFAKIPIVWQGS